MGVGRVYKQHGVRMREPTFKVDTCSAGRRREVEYQMGTVTTYQPLCSHTPPNSLISTARFHISDARNQNGEDGSIDEIDDEDLYLQLL